MQLYTGSNLKKNNMKTVLIIISFITVINFTGQAQSKIIVGQTSGNNIHYTDFEPDLSVELFNYSDSIFVDIDNDGIDDLAFIVSGEHDPQYYTRFTSSIYTLNKNVKIIATDNNNFVQKLNVGDTISANQSWSTDSVYRLKVQFISYYPPPETTTYYGALGSGYFGFEIEYPNETFYGWIHIYATSTSITVKETAIYGITVNIQETKIEPEPIHVFPNPCKNELTLDLNSFPLEDMSFKIINPVGQIVKRGNIFNSSLKVNTSELESVFYIIKINKKNSEIYTIKFIKE
jgi:hypothetical protein